MELCNDWTENKISKRLGCATESVFFFETKYLGKSEIQRIKKCGIKYIEIGNCSSFHFDHNNKPMIFNLVNECNKKGIKITSVHAPELPFTCPFKRINEAVVAETLEIALVAEEIGADVFVCHFGINEWSKRAAKAILKKLEGHKIMVGQENDVGVDLHEYVKFVDQINSEQLGIVLDIGHTLDSDGLNPMTKIDRARKVVNICKDRLVHVHLHDYKDKSDHWVPFIEGGQIQWGEVMGGLCDINYDGWLIFESASGVSPEDAMKYIVSFPSEYIKRYG
jgi:sugar phosphate isomerase/epimerase